MRIHRHRVLTNDSPSLTNTSGESFVVKKRVIAILYETLSELRYRYYVLYGGRGSGKSWGVADFLLEQALKRKHLILCTRQFQNSIEDSSYRILKELIVSQGLEDLFEIKRDKIICRPTKSEFIFYGLQNTTINSIRSMQGITMVWVEEAHSITDYSWEVLIPTIREPNSKFYITFNPEYEDDPTYVRFVANARDDTKVLKLNWYDNPFLSPELKKEMEYLKSANYESYSHIWEGEFRNYADTSVFKGHYVVDQFPEIPYTDGASYWAGADWGFSNDPTTLIEGFIFKDQLYINREVYGVGIELDEIARAFSVIERVKRGMRIYADCARPETISYLNKNRWKDSEGKDFGLNIEPCEKWKGSIMDGIEYIKNFKKVMIHQRCIKTIEEFQRYSYPTDKRTGEIVYGEQPVDRWNHCIDAIRYGLQDHIKQQGLEWLKNI